MDKEKPYLNSSLNLAELSSALDVSSKKLSQVINQSESLNYSQFVSKYRVAEAQARMQNDNNRHLKIAAIAYDCGFNSISSFNASFKKYAGTTAIAYRNSLEEKKNLM